MKHQRGLSLTLFSPEKDTREEFPDGCFPHACGRLTTVEHPGEGYTHQPFSGSGSAKSFGRGSSDRQIPGQSEGPTESQYTGM